MLTDHYLKMGKNLMFFEIYSFLFLRGRFFCCKSWKKVFASSVNASDKRFSFFLSSTKYKKDKRKNIIRQKDIIEFKDERRERQSVV